MDKNTQELDVLNASHSLYLIIPTEIYTQFDRGAFFPPSLIASITN